MELTPLKTSREAMRDLSIQNSRKWLIINPSVKNSLGMNSGYALIPGDNAVPYLGVQTEGRKRARFINHPFWATPYHPDQIFSAGAYPNQSQNPEGLLEWALKNESIVNKDIVVWYTVGITHVPRPEEWPVMTVTKTGFKLVPAAFFDQNPALDVPQRESKKP